MHEFRIWSDNVGLNDYLVDIISNRTKLEIVKKKIFPEGWAEITCRIATAKKRPRRSKSDVAELHNRVKKLHTDGLSNSEIARQIGCSRAYVSKILWYC